MATLRELKSLLAVADHGGITAASDAVHLSVAAVSAHVAQLEEQFGIPLLDRRHKPSSLTVAGLALATRARSLLQQFDALADDLGNTTGKIELVVGSSPTVLTHVLPLALKRLRLSDPLLKIKMVYTRPWILMEMVAKGELDLALMGMPRGYMPDLEWIPIAQEPLMVIAPPCAKGSSDRALLNEFPYIRYSKHLWVSKVIEKYLLSQRIFPSEILEVDTREAIEIMVHYGLGASVVPVSNLRVLKDHHRLVCAPLGDPPLSRQVGMLKLIESMKSAIIETFSNALTIEIERSGMIIR